MSAMHICLETSDVLVRAYIGTDCSHTWKSLSLCIIIPDPIDRLIYP